MSFFGYDFELVNESIIRNLLTLERESVIYADHWIKELQDFRHVKISFTKDEIDEYVRSMWAFELFIRAGSPKYASEVEGIPLDIAARADSYEIILKGGEKLGPPYHCPAAFLGPEIESLVCSSGPRRTILEEVGSAALLTTIKRAVDSLTPAIRSFNIREKGLSPWPIKQEDDLRDLLYVMLRSSIEDIKREEPVPSQAGTFKFSDLVSCAAKLFIELKQIAKKGRWKKVLDEIRIDIQSYIEHPDCHTLVFVIVDTVRDIQDPRLIERDFSKEQIIGSRKVDVHLFVREPQISSITV